MKLNYRGNAYEVPASIHSDSDSEHQPTQKLTYRGQISDYTPPPATVPEALDPDASAVTLSYRGVKFKQ